MPYVRQDSCREQNIGDGQLIQAKGRALPLIVRDQITVRLKPDTTYDGGRRWTIDDGRSTTDDRRWTIDDGLRPWTMDYGPWTTLPSMSSNVIGATPVAFSGASIDFRSPTMMIARWSMSRYFFATRKTSSAVIAPIAFPYCW